MKISAAILLVIITLASCHLKKIAVFKVDRDDTDVENLLLGLKQTQLIDLCFELDASLKKNGHTFVGGPCIYLNDTMDRGAIVEILMSFSKAWEKESYDLLMKDWILQ